MAKPLQGVLTSNSFQIWLDKTNEIVSIISNDTMTASAAPGGDITVGNATLIGSFTANTVTADLNTDSIASKTPSANVAFSSPVSIETTSQTASVFKSSLGARTSYSSDTSSWSVGFVDTTTNDFMINYGTGSPVFRFLSTGEVKLKSVTATGNVSAAYLTGNGSNITNISGGNVTGNLTNITSIDGSKITGTGSIPLTTIPLTIARSAITISGGSGISGGGDLTTNRTLAVDNTVLRTTGGQTVAGITNFSGSLGVRTASPSVALEVTGAGKISGNLDIGGSITAVGNISSNGNVTAYYVATPSDSRLKTNINTVENALEKVLKLRGVSYEMLDGGKKSIGVIAQEIEEIIPEVVLNEGEYKSVTYGNIVGILIEAIKELKSEVNALKSNKL